jgi:hypothetical protein
MDIPFKYCIYHKDSKFKNFSFLENPKKNIIEDLKHNICEKKYKEAVVNAVEMNISGWNKELLNNLIEIYIDDINIKNIDLLFRLTEYLELINYKKSLLKSKYSIELRNCKEVRNRIVDLIYLISKSPKTIKFKQFKKISKPKDTFVYNYKRILPNTSYITDYIYDEDDEDFCKILNKVYVNIRRSDKDLKSIHTWLELLFYIENERKKSNKEARFYSRKMVNITDTQKQDWIWIVWKILIELSNPFPVNQKIIKTLLKLFKFNYTKARRKTRINFIMMACHLVKYPITKLKVENHYFIENRIELVGFTNLIYKQFSYCLDDTLDTNKEARLNYEETKQISLKPPPKPKKPTKPKKKVIEKQEAQKMIKRMEYLYNIVRDNPLKRPDSKSTNLSEYRIISLGGAEDLPRVEHKHTS